MPVGHARFNEKEPNPNPDITFITAKKDQEDHETALYILKAVAAQIRPITKSNGFAINSLEEFEWNRQFAGRNWNAGETIELVLRRQNGDFYPFGMILHVMCHELAHCVHMHHGPAFVKLNKKLKDELQALRARNYFGDGFWSDGKTLNASELAPDREVKDEELPMMTCGGALNKKKQPNGSFRYEGAGVHTKKRKRARTVKPSLHTGVQTSTPRKAGQRVKADVFKGEGHKVDEEGESTFRKRAQSKNAREARLAAVEARVNNERFGNGLPPLDYQLALPFSRTSRASPSKKAKPVKHENDEEDELAGESDYENNDDDRVTAYDPAEVKRLQTDLRSWRGHRAPSVTSDASSSSSAAPAVKKAPSTSKSSLARSNKGKDKQKEVIILSDSDPN